MNLLKIFLFLILIFNINCSSSIADKKLNYLTDQYEINLSIENEIKTSGGLIITFDETIIKTIKSISNTSKIIVKVNEFYDVSDFIFNNLQTVTKDKKLLESAGMFRIEIFSNEQRLNIEDLKGLSILFPIKNEKKDEYRLFEGELLNNDLIVWKNPTKIEEVELEQDTSISLTTSYMYDETGNILDSVINETGYYEHLQLNYLKILPKELSWINIDRFLKMQENELADITVEIDKNYEEQIVGIVLKNSNSFISLYPKKNNANKYESFIRLPIGEEIKVIGFGKKGNNYFLANKDIIVGKREDITLDLKVISVEELHPKLKR